MNAKPHTLDSEWFDRLQILANISGETFSQLEPDPRHLAELREEFTTSGYATNPNLTARHLDLEALDARKTHWHALAHEITARETSQTVADLYQARIAESLNEATMLMASASGNMAEFDQCNEAIYSRPDQAVYNAVLAWAHRQAGSETLLPNLRLFQNIKQLHLSAGGYLEQLFGAHSEFPAIISTDIGDAICRRAMERLGSSFTLQNSKNGLWAVLPSQRIVARPDFYQLDRRAFMAIVGHEIGSHLAEVVHGSRQPLGLLQIGLDRYEAGNEGRAWIREQIMYDSPEEYSALSSFEYRVALHLAIAAGLGYTGQPASFSEIYGIIFELYRAWNNRRQPGASESMAHDAAWNLTVRVCKGTDGQGWVYRKDIVYLEGNLRCWKVAESHPQRILQGDLGKFDVANQHHIAILKKLDILPVTA